MNAAVARDLGTKLVLCSGTDAGIIEMEEKIPSVHYVVATISKGRELGMATQDPKIFQKGLTERVKAAILDRDNIETIKDFQGKNEWTVDLNMDAPKHCPHQVSKRQLKWTAKNAYEGHVQYRRVLTALRRDDRVK